MALENFTRLAATALIGVTALATSLAPANAADKVTFLTSWFAQAEHGGFYQAKANGLYEKAGLDVTIKMGGPQINGAQLLLAGDAVAVSRKGWPDRRRGKGAQDEWLLILDLR